jgi:HlyD family secretion protein
MPMPRTQRRAVYAGVLLLVVGLLVFMLAPEPIEVDVATAVRAPLQVTVDEDGETRARDRFVVSAPVAGRVARIDLREGDRVTRDQVVAQIWALPLSAREREEQLARIAAAEALVREAEERVRRAETDHAQARRDRARAEELVRRGIVAPQESEKTIVAERTRAIELEEARYRRHSAAADAEAARAARLALTTSPDGPEGSVRVRAPVAGQVLRVPERSERVVAAGTPLLIIGDSSELEVVLDVLSTEAVAIVPGMAVLLEGWGGGDTLRARVRVVEPFAFTKVSALGVEEQRVNVVADFVDLPGRLGDAYRVDAHIVVWSAADVLTVPASAVFRRGEGMSIFVVENGRARRRNVGVGHRGALEVEIVDGLRAGEVVIRHPSNDVDDGVRVWSR